jgi:hypothetical protein
MAELYSFIAAVASHWVSLMSGIASVIVALWLRLKNKVELGHLAFWGVAVICIFIASFQAWKEEHLAKLALESQVSDLRREIAKKEKDIEKLNTEVSLSSVLPEAQDSLRKRTKRLADDIDAFQDERRASHPPFTNGEKNVSP